jgi:phage terminase large subunit-like protein
MSDDQVEVNISAMRARMSDSEYRRAFQKLDFVELAPQQNEAINSPYRYSLIQAGNQSGKTHAGAIWTTLRCLRRTLPGSTAYPMPPVRTDGTFGQVVWCLAPTNQMVRDGVMLRLLGDVGGGRIGTGFIPADRVVSYTKAHAISGLVDTAVIKADDGSLSALRFKSYDQSREALQSEPVSAIWCDELLDDEAQWNELIARGTATSGGILMTATPKKQQSPVMRWFKAGGPDRKIYRMSTRKTIHLTDEQVDAMARNYSPLELKTRLEGDEYQGGGLVLVTNKEMSGTDRHASTYHEYMLRIVGLDPHHGGMSENANPTAVIYCCWNSVDDVLNVVGGWKQKHISPEQAVARIKQTSWANAPVAWGRAEKQGTGSGGTYHDMYANLGLKMLPTYAALPDGSLSLELTFDLLQNAMMSGKLKISNDFFELWDEINSLERDEHNRIIERHDDLLAALRYAYLCRKRAKIAPGNMGGAFGDMGGSRYRVITPKREAQWGE